jgi:hypothetical protein
VVVAMGKSGAARVPLESMVAAVTMTSIAMAWTVGVGLLYFFTVGMVTGGNVSGI